MKQWRCVQLCFCSLGICSDSLMNQMKRVYGLTESNGIYERGRGRLTMVINTTWSHVTKTLAVYWLVGILLSDHDLVITVILTTFECSDCWGFHLHQNDAIRCVCVAIGLVFHCHGSTDIFNKWTKQILVLWEDSSKVPSMSSQWHFSLPLLWTHFVHTGRNFF